MGMYGPLVLKLTDITLLMYNKDAWVTVFSPGDILGFFKMPDS